MEQVYDGDLRWKLRMWGWSVSRLEGNIGLKTLPSARFLEPLFREEMEFSEGTEAHGFYCARYLMLARRIEALLYE